MIYHDSVAMPSTINEFVIIELRTHLDSSCFCHDLYIFVTI